jgi:hypothetical protein
MAGNGDCGKGKAERVWFPGWLAALEGVGDARERASFDITLRWYLGWCTRRGVGASISSACDFLEEAERDKAPSEWALAGWKRALRWFFTEARRRGCVRMPSLADSGDGEQPDALDSICCEWERRLVVSLRRDDRMLRTEQAYRGWLRRYLRWLGGRDPREAGVGGVEGFLEDLAVRQLVARGTQRQALNALVYFYRSALDAKLGELRFERGHGRRRLPVVLSR